MVMLMCSHVSRLDMSQHTPVNSSNGSNNSSGQLKSVSRPLPSTPLSASGGNISTTAIPINSSGNNSNTQSSGSAPKSPPPPIKPRFTSKPLPLNPTQPSSSPSITPISPNTSANAGVTGNSGSANVVPPSKPTSAPPTLPKRDFATTTTNTTSTSSSSSPSSSSTKTSSSSSGNETSSTSTSTTTTTSSPTLSGSGSTSVQPPSSPPQQIKPSHLNSSSSNITPLSSSSPKTAPISSPPPNNYVTLGSSSPNSFTPTSPEKRNVENSGSNSNNSSSNTLTFEKHTISRDESNHSLSSHSGTGTGGGIGQSISSGSISSYGQDESPDADRDHGSGASVGADERKSIFKKFPHQWAIGKLEKESSQKEIKKEEKERKEIERKEEKERKEREKEKEKAEKKERKEREKLEKKEKEKEKEKGEKDVKDIKDRILSRTSSSIASKLKNATLTRNGRLDHDDYPSMNNNNNTSPIIGSSGGSALSFNSNSSSSILSSSPNQGNGLDSPHHTTSTGGSFTPGSSPPLNAVNSAESSLSMRSATQLDTSRGLMTWGSGSYCKLGFKSVEKDSQPTPERLPNFNISDICSISCGSYYSAALTENGDVYMWGRGSVKNPPIATLGNGTFDDQLLPQKVESLQEIVVISIGFYHSAAVKSNGELLTWGCGEDGQLGHGDVFNQPIPKVVQSITSHWVTQVQCGEKHTICLTKNGKVFTWGTSEYGQLGLGDTQKNCTPMLVTSLDKYHIIQIACGATHNAVLTNNREVLVFGNGAAMGSANIISIPIMVPSLKIMNIERLSCGHYSTAALTECGDVYTWGSGQELGHGHGTSEAHPKLVETLRNQSIRQISCGGRHMAFLTDSGKIYTSGKDPFGQLGHAAGDQNRPKKIDSLLKTTFMSISCGENHNAALFDTTRSFRDKFCWKLLETQRTLVRSLNIIRSIFLSPLLIRDREQLPENMKHLPYIFLSEEEIKTLFGAIDKIYQVNSNTLHLMNNRLHSWSNKKKIGDILLNHFKSSDVVFNQYIDHMPFAIHSLENLLKKSNSPFNISGMVKYTKNTHIDYQGLVDLEAMLEEKQGKVQTILGLVNSQQMLASYIASQVNPPSASDDSSSFLKEYDAKIESLQNFKKTCLKLIKSSKKYYEVEPEAFKEQGHFSENLLLAKSSLDGLVDTQLAASLDHFSQSIKKIGYLRSELSTRTNSAFSQPLSQVADELDAFIPLIVEMRKRVFDAHQEYDSAVNKLYSLAKNLQPTDKKMMEAEKEVSNLKKALDRTVYEFDAIFKEGIQIQSRSLKLFYACMKAQQEYFERGLQRFQSMKPSFDALDSHFRQQSRATWSKSIHETLTSTFSDKSSKPKEVVEKEKEKEAAIIVEGSPSASSSFIAVEGESSSSSSPNPKAAAASSATIDPQVILAELESTDWSYLLDPPTANEFTDTFIEEQYDQMVELLASPSLQVVQCVVSPCSQEDQIRTIESISRIFDSFNKIRPIIQTGIEVEVQSTANPSTLFRSNTTATKLMTAFTKMKGMPYLTKIITPLVVKKFPDNKHSSVGGFVFLRFLCPAIIAPYTAGLVDEAPGPEATRALVLIGKVLQNLANGIEFGQKESFMIPVNRFIIGNLSRLNEYFDKLTDVPDYRGDYIPISTRDEVQKDIRNIHLLIVKNLSKVLKQLALYKQKEIIGQLAKTLVFLGDPQALNIIFFVITRLVDDSAIWLNEGWCDGHILSENLKFKRKLLLLFEMNKMIDLKRVDAIIKSVLIKIIEYFPKYELSTTNIVTPEQRLPLGPTLFLSFQHVLAMFGSSVVCPLLMGFNANTGLLFSGIGTLIFYVCTGGRVPSYVGNSFAFIGVVNAATNFHYIPGGPTNQHIPVALGGMFVCGLIYLAISLIVIFLGYRWLEILMPPVVTGAVVLAIGLNLAGSAITQAAVSGFDAWFSFCTVMSVALVTMYAPGPLKRLPILIGGLFAYLLYLFFGLGGIGPGIDFKPVHEAKWIGAPPIHYPVFETGAITLIAPVAIILVAENIGHVKAVGSITGKPIDQYIGRAFLGDSLATIFAVSFGSIGTTTYAENIGVMSITRVFSTLNFVIAGLVAIFLGLLPIFGGIIQTIPSGVFGGLSIVLFGMVAATGARIWISNKINFSKPRNMLTAGISLVLGIGMANGTVITWGVVKIDAIGAATLSAIILYQLLRENWIHIFRYVIAKCKGQHYEIPEEEEDEEDDLHGGGGLPQTQTPTLGGKSTSSSSDLELPTIGEDSCVIAIDTHSGSGSSSPKLHESSSPLNGSINSETNSSGTSSSPSLWRSVTSKFTKKSKTDYPSPGAIHKL
ncbi:regulator of chromosome condensation domain-containing protein [Heterostelium album PN500]|uniref:Regulator of chromosome condensation domain-containing protein n=1 Tax=Heterostelium pallidum (strain ATCC 26659 / Pp 5 / PN500) TaxID=670386 RepID=D3BNB8_HETP5|nr:regulator of chromosome condensation domain-containing protein [Heterostelium album PN500]EFA76778.1 regulator of chromosome condensation domain-containing protein [Heterostelium album PN500]|eukprot:XP_020428910.1 regulator of chromosome condensation domain-containing protein [Heterostelium album PN500]